MKIPRSELTPIIAKLAVKLPAKKLADEVASYLLTENRTGELDSIARDLVNYRAENGVVEVTAVSARELTASSFAEVKSEVKRVYPSAKEIIINQRIDADQIGGVRLEFPDKQLDLSIRQKLNHFKQLTVKG